MIALVLTLVACVPRLPPPVFSVEIPEAQAPPHLEDLDELWNGDTCLEAAPYIPGEPPPFTVDGRVSCRAQVVPDADVVACLHDRDLVTYWRDVADTCQTYRAVDRARCEDVAGHRWEYAQDLRGELRRARIETSAAAAAGLVIGLAVGMAAAEIGR